MKNIRIIIGTVFLGLVALSLMYFVPSNKETSNQGASEQNGIKIQEELTADDVTFKKTDWVEAGLKYEATKEYSKAIEAYENAINEDERTLIPWINSAAIFKMQGKYDLAEIAYKNVIRIFSAESQGYLNLAELYLSGKIGAKVDAIKILEEGVKNTTDKEIKAKLAELKTKFSPQQ